MNEPICESKECSFRDCKLYTLIEARDVAESIGHNITEDGLRKAAQKQSLRARSFGKNKIWIVEHNDLIEYLDNRDGPGRPKEA